MHHGVGRGIGHAEFTNVFTSSAPPASAGQNSIACFASPLKLMYGLSRLDIGISSVSDVARTMNPQTDTAVNAPSVSTVTT
jgi:hypothetical protein